MHTSIKALAASTVLAIGAMLALTPTPALANAPAPQCDTGARSFICSPYASATSYTWSVNWIELGNPFSYTETISGDLINNCDAGYSYSVTYSYTSGGTTVTSDTQRFLCNPGAWP